MSGGETTWQLDRSSGRQEFVKHMRHLIKEDPNFVFRIGSGVTKCIYQLVSQTMKRQVKLEAAINMLGELVCVHHDMPGLLLDVFGIMDAETSFVPESEERTVFCSLVKEMETFVPENLLKERMEIDTLQEVGTVKNRTFYTRFIKVKTKVYYKQRRFNLFREEAEGYAKLITELNQEADALNVDTALEAIKSLIGCFNLDPNRVLDIILESFEMHPERSTLFLPLLQSYLNDGRTICEVLGAKFRYYTDIRTPFSLFKVTAILLQAEVINVDEIYAWLGPEDTKLVADWKQEITEAKEFSRKLNALVTKDDDELVVVPENRYEFNQKWRLVEALLDIGDWRNANLILKKLPEHSVMVHEPIAKALCALIHILIEPIYRLKCRMGTGKGTPALQEKLKLPPVTTVGKLATHVIPMFIALGPSLHYDPILLHKLLILMKVILADMAVDMTTPPSTENEPLYYNLLTLLDTTVLPTQCYLNCNCCVSEQIWDILKLLPYQLRYSLYGRWKRDTYLINPELIRKHGTAKKQMRTLMNSINTTNVKPTGRQIGKLSHCSPGLLFDYVLLQVQNNDKLVSVTVDAFRYLTSLSYDMLGYCLIDFLANTERQRLTEDCTGLAQWFKNIADYCGAIFKKYNIELTGLLQYVANQLKAKNSLDLLILKEIIQKMTGADFTVEMTKDQAKAMCGGEILRAEAGQFTQVRNTKKSAVRLKDAIAVNDLAVALPLLIAQQKQCVIYHETTDLPLKLVGILYDQCQDILVQFGAFLGSNYSVDEYTERLPSIHAMLQEYHIHEDVAFSLARPMFAHAINQKYDQLRKADPAKKLTSAQKLAKHLEATQFVMEPVANAVQSIHPAKVWEDLSPQFFCTFWSLSMYDLGVPTDAYLQEINKLKKLSIAIMDNKEANASKNKKDQERYVALMEKLQDERKKQQEHVDKVMHRLTQEKDSWFMSRSLKTGKNEAITQFLQLCLFPRCTFTALDALYCAKFIQTIHSLKTSNFATLLCYDRILCDITLPVTSCTENEAHRYGRFLCSMLDTVMSWHKDEALFNKECANYPGFVTKFRVSTQNCEATDHVNYENYRHVCHKWHYKLTKAIVFCLDSKDFVKIRNALIVLVWVLPHFPVLEKLGQLIINKVEKVMEEERLSGRKDICALTTSCFGQLKRRVDDFLPEHKFHYVPPEKVAAVTKVVIKAPIDVDASKPDIKAEPTKVPSSVKEEKKPEKKLSRAPIKSISPQTQVIDLEKERPREKSPSPILVRETSGSSTNSKSSASRDKKAERREKERDDDRKRDRGERRRKKPSPDQRGGGGGGYDYYKADDVQVIETDRRERELSSVSNSSNGSPLRVMEPPEIVERDTKRRKIDAPKKGGNNADSKRDKSNRAPKREKAAAINEDPKELRREKRKRDREEFNTEKRLRRGDDDKSQHKNGGGGGGGGNGNEPASPRISSKHHHRDVSPYDREEHEQRDNKYKSRGRSSY